MGVGPHSGLAPVGAGAKPPQGDERDEASSQSWLSRSGKDLALTVDDFESAQSEGISGDAEVALRERAKAVTSR